jgi:CheY-like chemotaxis protein
MVAENEPDQRWLFQHWLMDSGYHVKVVEDGAWVLALVPPNPPDLILIDIQLPEVDGFEVCRQLKQDPQHKGIPVLVMSFTADRVTQDQAELAKADGLIQKPFSRTELTGKVEDLKVEDLIAFDRSGKTGF